VDGLPCLNCQRQVAATEAKIFAGTYCCPTCFEIAQRIEARLESELKRMLVMLRESIRISIVERRLVLGPADAARDLSKKEVLEAIIQLQTARGNAAPPAPTDRSKEEKKT
jgi:hypothetical protein